MFHVWMSIRLLSNRLRRPCRCWKRNIRRGDSAFLTKIESTAQQTGSKTEKVFKKVSHIVTQLSHVLYSIVDHSFQQKMAKSTLNNIFYYYF